MLRSFAPGVGTYLVGACLCAALLTLKLPAQTGARPQSDRVLPAYPAEVAACQDTQPEGADAWMTMDPMAIPKVLPIDGQRIAVRLVPDTVLNRFLFTHLRKTPVAEPAAIRCARELRPAENGLYAIDHVHDGSYLLWVTLSVNRSIQLGGGQQMSHGSTAEGVPVTVMTQGSPSQYNYVETRNIVSEIKIVAGKASVTNPRGWMEPN